MVDTSGRFNMTTTCDSDFKANEKRINSSKGGVNKKPTTPRPSPPKGQQGSRCLEEAYIHTRPEPKTEAPFTGYLFKELGGKKMVLNSARYNQNIALLDENKIKYKMFNEGKHLRIGSFDFWPSTGTYMHRVSGKKGTGVYNLLDEILLEEDDLNAKAIKGGYFRDCSGELEKKYKPSSPKDGYFPANDSIKQEIDNKPTIPNSRIVEKPPLGLKPQYIFLLERRIEIILTMKRFAKAKKPIPLEWIEELDEIITKEHKKYIKEV